MTLLWSLEPVKVLQWTSTYEIAIITHTCVAGLAWLQSRAGGHGFDSRGRTNTQVLKITEKWRYWRLDLRVARMTTWNGGPVFNRGRKKTLSPISFVVLNTLCRHSNKVLFYENFIWLTQVIVVYLLTAFLNYWPHGFLSLFTLHYIASLCNCM